MTTPYRFWVFVTNIVFFALSLVATPAHAQEWPVRPVTMMVPFPAGGGGDVYGRVFAAHLSELLGQPVIVENLPGTGGMVGAARVARAAPDGYTLLLASAGTHAYSQSIYKAPLYNAATDFTPVALLAEQPLVLITRKDLPANNLQEFTAFARSNQSKMHYGSDAGVGSANHLVCLLLNSTIGVKITHVPYRGGALPDLLTGRIDYYCPLVAPHITPHVASGAVKAMAILSKSRTSVLPDTPSAFEQGLADFEGNTWFAFFLPKGTPDAIVQKLHRATVAAMSRTTLQAKLNELGAQLVAPERRSPEYLKRFVASEIEKWAATIKSAGVVAE